MDNIKKLKTSLPNHRPLNDIAQEIFYLWIKINPYAQPYLDAMMSLNQITETYGLDSGRSIVSYALANMHGFSGPDAKRIKKELNDIIKLLDRNPQLQEIANQNVRRKYNIN